MQTFSVSGISCSSCVEKINAAFQKESQLNSFEVLRGPDRINLKGAKPMSIDDVNNLFAKHDLLKHKASAFEIDEPATPSLFKQLYPLTLTISYILLAVLAVAWATSNFSWQTMMAHYMAGFFIVFSFFKFLNIEGFADAFRSYDPISKAWRPYGYFYASFELAAGIGYLLQPQSLWLNLTVLIVLGISSWGVTQAVLSGSRIQCACLGTVFNLPMTKVTIVENVSMMAMALMTIIGPSLF